MFTGVFMKIILKQDDQILEKDIIVKKENNFLTYQEDDVYVAYDLNNHILTRENDDYKVSLKFILNEITDNEFILKKENLKLMMKLKTYELKLDNDLYIKYEINDMIKEFKIGGIYDN